MIAILGTSADDILYYRGRIADLSSEQPLKGLTCYRGTFMNEDVVVAALGPSDYVSAMNTAIILERYAPYLVFNIGTVVSFNDQFKQGDLFIPSRYYLSDVDFMSAKNCQYGQIPGFPPFITGDVLLNKRAEQACYLMTMRYIQRGYLISGETSMKNQERLKTLVHDHFILQDDYLGAYDNTSGGVALACHTFGIPLLTIKAVSCQLSRPDQFLSAKRRGLELMPTIGRIIARFSVGDEEEDEEGSYE